MAHDALRALALSPLDTPFLAFDPRRGVEQLDRLRSAMPGVSFRYAVKANPHPGLLALLAAHGCGFDVASVPEARAALRAGAHASSVLYGNTLKKEGDVAQVAGMGISLFAVDTAEECGKLSRAAPGASFYVRLAVPNADAEWPLSRKFGASPAEALGILEHGRTLGLHAAGLSFHVGSQQREPSAWTRAIGMAAGIMHDAAAMGIHLDILNVGGGFPVDYAKGAPPIGEFGEAILSAARALPAGVRLLAEPGRYIAAPCGIMACEVVGTAVREGRRWLYLDAGRFGGLAETEGEAIKYSLEALADGEPTPFVVAGPTCDGADILYERNPVTLPGDIRPGCRVLIHMAGAYTTVYASHSFNGMPGPSVSTVDGNPALPAAA